MAGRHDSLLRLLDLGLPDDLPDADLRALGFREPARVRDGLGRLRARIDVARAVDMRRAELLRALSECCDPDTAFALLENWLDAGGAALCGDPLHWAGEEFLRLLCTLFAATPALSQYLVRFPARTRPTLDPVCLRQVAGGAAWRRMVLDRVARAGPYLQQLAALRHARTEAMLQIAALDLLSVSRLEDTTRALSDLADACMDGAIAIGVERLKPKYGSASPRKNALPGSAAPFTVIGMGKQGGRELNYSSDIDLVFVYAEDGQTEGGPRPTPHREYFTRLAEEVVQALNQSTEDGRVYRVDMRLRPYGSVGPLVVSGAELLAYLQSEGRTWERQAWLKARACAGDREFGDGLLRQLEPFVYRRFLSLDAIGDIQALKKQIEREVSRKGEADEEVKLGRGGIRDIEFTVQFLQLLHGGEQTNVRNGSTLRALRALRGEGLLQQVEAERLEEAYIFHRHVEHRLQLHGDQQTHKLPQEAGARRRLALAMGYEDDAGAVSDALDTAQATAPKAAPLQSASRGGLGVSRAAQAAARNAEAKPAPKLAPPRPGTAEFHFEGARQRHVLRVREIFETLFAKLFPARAGQEGELSDLLLAPEPNLEEIAALLPRYGLRSGRSSAEELVALCRERIALTNPSRTRKFFASLAPALLKALAATGEAEGALKRFSRIAGSLGAKAVFYQSLHENPWLLKMTVELAAWSEYLTEVLVANPGLFDEVIDALRTDRSKTQAEMERELSSVIGGGEVGDTLRAYRSGEILRIGVRDLFHGSPLEETQTELTALAGTILRAHLHHTLKTFQTQRGLLVGTDGKPVGFAVLGVGKLGGMEMNYGSDLDVLFFYGQDGTTPDGLPAGPYFSELAQHLTRAMSEPTILGRLYNLDARLRPNGNKGPLASSLEAFEHYWKEGSLADWERLALTRARFLAGDAGVGERAEHLLRTAVYSPLKSTALAEEVRSMRRRIEETSGAGDLKRGRGGLVDIEFLVQYFQLLHGPAFPPLRQTNTKASLKTLLKFKKLTAVEGGTLLEAYDFLSRISNRIRIVHGLSSNQLPDKPEDLQKLALSAGYMNAPGLSAGELLGGDYDRLTRAVREIFDHLTS